MSADALCVELGTPIMPGFEALFFKASRGIEDIDALTYIRKDASRFPVAGVCVEKEDVFAATHELVLRWVNGGRIGGLRIDHPDGLRDPISYLERLRAAAPRIWVVVEKILEPRETLAPGWPVAGTTGYDFLNIVNGLFIEPRSEKLLTDFCGELTGQSTDFGEIVQDKKQLVIKLLFSSELSNLENLLADSCRRYPDCSAFRQEDVRRALAEVLACFPVYRT